MQSSPKPIDIGLGGGETTDRRFVWKSASGLNCPLRRMGGISDTPSGRMGGLGVGFEASTDLRVEMFEEESSMIRSPRRTEVGRLEGCKFRG